MRQQSDLLFSVIVPVKDEEDSIPGLAAEITAALTDLPCPWECLWVNDGSVDATGTVLDQLADDDPRHRHIELARNFGQSAALAMGFRLARGDVIGTLDGDGQNDPADLPSLVAHLLEQDVHMVNGIRRKRRDNWIRRISSKIGNGFRNSLTHESVTDVGCAIRVFVPEAVRDVVVFKGMHRFLPTLVKLRGYKVTEVPVNHRPREQGRTKYGINNRLWVGIGDVLAVRWMQRRLVNPQLREPETANS